MNGTPDLIVRRFPGLTDYSVSLQAMKQFNATRHPLTADEIWVLEHPAVFTLGQAGLTSHLLTNPKCIPVVRSDRGGQITYHGPGQLIFYLLLDLKRLHITVKQLVFLIEEAIISTLKRYHIEAHRVEGAPGVYVNESKIAALGLRIQNGYSRHGFSLNLNMDMTPFSHINPCGYERLLTTQIIDWVTEVNRDHLIQSTIQSLADVLKIKVADYE